MNVSVIIPIYHDWEYLRTCIDSLSKQTYSQEKYEVIIVNNDPEDTPPNLGLPANFRIISELKPGSYAARNAGIKKAKGEILAFTDADCIPSVNWLNNGVDQFNNGVERIAGKIEFKFSDGKKNVIECYEELFSFNQKKYAYKGVSVTANMFSLKENFDKVGYFNENLLSGGDIEWGNRAKQEGISIIYASNVIVQHPARNKWKEVLTKNKRLAGGRNYRKEKMWLLETFKLLFRGFTPPLSRIKKVIKASDLTVTMKLKLLIFLYVLKIHKSTCKIFIGLGFINRERN